MSFLIKMVSGPDNSSPDLARVLFALTWLVWAIACVMYLWHVKDAAELISGFPSLFGLGATLLVTGSASVLIKHATEPKQPQ